MEKCITKGKIKRRKEIIKRKKVENTIRRFWLVISALRMLSKKMAAWTITEKKRKESDEARSNEAKFVSHVTAANVAFDPPPPLPPSLFLSWLWNDKRQTTGWAVYIIFRRNCVHLCFVLFVLFVFFSKLLAHQFFSFMHTVIIIICVARGRAK